jgi:fumarate hydratase class II
MGEMRVPANAYYGAQTRRAELNFAISPLRMPRPIIRALGSIKRAAAIVNRDLGLLPDQRVVEAIVQAASEIADGSHDDQFVVDVFQTGSGTSSNMNANEATAGRANEILGKPRGGKSPVHPNDHVNLGQSSNDVFPTAIHLAAADGIRRRLIPALKALHAKLAEKAAEFDRVVKIGRTHLQDAVPIRLGQEFGGYAAQVQLGIERLNAALERLIELPIGGTAVGTGINTHAEFARRMVARLEVDYSALLRPARNTFESMANKDAAIETSAALRTVAISLSNIANNIRWLASGPRCGIGEIQIPELQPGSSIMPGKVNPVIPEAVIMVAAQVVGNDATIAWAGALGSNFELNVAMPVIAYTLVQSIDLLTEAAHHLHTRCLDAREFFMRHGIKPPGVDQLVADPGASRSIEQSLAMCTSLAPCLGYDLAAAIAKHAYATGGNVRDVVRSIAGLPFATVQALLGLNPSVEEPSGGIPPWSELEPLLDPYAQTLTGTGVGRAAGG